MNVTHLKIIHVVCVILTFISFSIRGYWMIIGSSLLRHRLTRILPHIMDSLLLLSGLLLAIWVYGEFYKYTWLMIKLAGIVFYIFLGGIAIRYGKTRKIRIIALVLSLCVFLGIVALARYNSLVHVGVFGL